MRRREFIALLGGAGAAAYPLPAHAQQSERVRRIGVLMTIAGDDPYAILRITAFAQELQKLGWTVGQNLRIEYRFGSGDGNRVRKDTADLVALGLDVIVANGSLAMQTLQSTSRTVPIVFAQVIDPVGAGFVESLAKPGGNATGFTTFEYSLSGKWLELLKEIAPRVLRVAVLRDSVAAAGSGQFGAIQALAQSFKVDLRPIDVREPTEMERAITAFARGPDGGMIVTGSGFAVFYREKIIGLAARHRLPAVYSNRLHVDSGGLASYGPDVIDHYRRVAGYVDRILRGAKPADLPVQQPTKYELVINLKTAKALGLTVSPMLIARADEVIE